MTYRFGRTIAVACVLIVLAHHGVMAMNPHGEAPDSLAVITHDNIAVMACGISESHPMPVQPVFDPPVGNAILPTSWFDHWIAATPAGLSWIEPVHVGSVLRALLQVFLN